MGQSQLEEVSHGWDPHSDSDQREREGVVLFGSGYSLMQYSLLKARFIVMQRLSRIVQHVTNAMNAICFHKQMDNFCVSFSHAV